MRVGAVALPYPHLLAVETPRLQATRARDAACHRANSPPLGLAEQEARRCCRREGAAKHSQERVEPGFVCGRRQLRGRKVNLIDLASVVDQNAILSNAR